VLQEWQTRLNRLGGFQVLTISTGDPLWWVEFIAEEASVELPMLVMDKQSEEYRQYQLEGEDIWLLVLDDEGVIQFRDSGEELDYHAAFDTAKSLLEAQDSDP